MSDDDKRTDPNPARYRDMCVPHESNEAAALAYQAFYDDVVAARLKHRIADVHIISRMVALVPGGEGDGLMSMHIGDETQSEAMTAFAYGFEQKQRRNFIAAMLSGERKRTRK